MLRNVAQIEAEMILATGTRFEDSESISSDVAWASC